MKFKVFAWSLGIILIVVFGFKAVFSYLYILGLISPAPDFTLPNTINLIDRTLVATVIVLSGIFLILRKKLSLYLLLAGTIGSIFAHFTLKYGGNIEQFIKGPSVFSLVFLGIASLILIVSINKNYME